MTKGADKPIVIITGSAGKMGTALTQTLQNTYRVVGFDQDESTCEIPCNITSDNSLALAFKLVKEKYGTKIAAVIHLAAYFDFTGEESPLYSAVNINGTKNLLMKLQDFQVERFIYSSTILVHKPCALGETINEDSPLSPKWPYPKSKVEAEKVIANHHGTIPYLILRLAGLYDDATCVPTLANQIARSYERDIKSYLYAGELKAGQSFIHHDDLMNIFKKALLHRNELEEEEIILVGEPKAISYEKLQGLISQFIHEEKSTLYNIPVPIAKAGAWLEHQTEPLIPDDFDQGEKPFVRSFMIDLASDNYALDVSKAKKVLNWEPQHTIEETVPKIIKTLKSDPEHWYEINGLTKPDWMVAIKDNNPEKIRSLYESNFRKQHQQNLWAHFLNIGFGFWLITSPATLGYTSYPLMLSDILSGILLIFLAFIGLFISRYMAAYQLGHIDHVWDPFFIGSISNAKNGTEEIITSSLSKSFPIPDAGLGAAVYILEIVTGIIGGSNRWRTMPWLVLLFGIMIIPLGVISITFIVIQPILLNTWCTLCLIAAIAMLLQVPYSFDELVATSTFLWRRWKAGRPILRVLFVGDSDEMTRAKNEAYPFEQSPRIVIREMLSGGITLPWNLMLCLLIGIWLMFTRITLDAVGSMANADHLIGSLVITVTITALAETVRVVRFLNLFFALALLITPFLYSTTVLATIASIVCGGLLFILSIPRGKICSSYGAWDKIIV